MSLISVVVTLIVVGLLLWVINTYIPMDGKIKQILNVVVVICVVVWLLYAFGIISRAGTSASRRFGNTRFQKSTVMIPNHPDFIEAIHEKKKVNVRFYSTPDAEVVDRVCAPLDYGPGGENPEGVNRYWLWDCASVSEPKILGLAPQQILDMRMLGEMFEPNQLHPPLAPHWSIPRTWGLGPAPAANGTGATSHRPTPEPMSRLSSEIPTAVGPCSSAKGTANFPFRILVVDDEPSICALNAKALAHHGYRVDAVEDGSAAWQILQLQSYDLMITDNNMPNLSGLSLIRNLRAASMALPIIMATGLAPHEEFDRDPGLKPDAILNKPYTIGELLEKVVVVLQASACRRSAVSGPQVQPDP